MVAAYAALVSLINTLQISRHVSLHTPLIQSLQQTLMFLVEFLEEGWKLAKDLEDRTVDAAHAAEDAIEFYTVNQFLAPDDNESLDLAQSLWKIIQDMDSIKAEAMQIKEKGEIKTVTAYPGSSEPAGSSCAPCQRYVEGQMYSEMFKLIDKLVWNKSSQRLIPIVGMGGIGKTALAKMTFTSEFVVPYFDIRAWAVVSQEYDLKDILTQILLSIGQSDIYSRNFHVSANEMSHMNEENLGERVYKALSGRRYLIVIDDIWDIDVWNMIKRFLPNNNQESRVMVTTRLSDVATQIGANPLEKEFLNDGSSWHLLKHTVFGEEACPIELEWFGKIIATKCRGLPLTIVLIGGLLAKSDMTPEYWRHVAEDARWAMYSNCELEEGYMNIFCLSYNHLPIHLKPCFLYMGLFREDQEIRISELTKLWVGEGILKPISGRIMEDVAQEYLNDLIGRNLILISRRGSSGKIKSCQIHDLLRDLCLREAQKENFLCVLKSGIPNVPEDMNRQRCIVLSDCTSSLTRHLNQILESLQSTFLTRSLTCSLEHELQLLKLRLLRVLNVADKYIHEPSDDVGEYSLERIFGLVNSRFLALRPGRPSAVYTFPVDRLRNLQTIIVRGSSTQYAPSEIWRLLQLRHIKFESIHLPEPEDDVVLENFLTMKTAENFVSCDRVVDKILNTRKLRIRYNQIGKGLLTEWSRYCPRNIGRFQRLESLALYFPSTYYKDRIISRTEMLQNLVIPHSVKKLILKGCGLGWEDMTLIGSLPCLEVLKLYGRSFVGTEWSPIDGEFLCLKYLQIYDCCDLIHWRADDTSFPRLERIVFRSLCLEEIPIEIGDIQTLQSIKLDVCSKSMILSAKRILEDQEDYGNQHLQLHVVDMLIPGAEEQSESEVFVSNSFHVEMRVRRCSAKRTSTKSKPRTKRELQLLRRAAPTKGKSLEVYANGTQGF